MGDSSLHHTLATAFSLGMVILLSPEVFVLGLVMAAHQTRAKLNSGLFFLGSAIGLFVALGFGIWITPASTSPNEEHASWLRFFVRSGIGTALLGVGLYRAKQFFFDQTDATPKEKAPPANWKKVVASFFPSLQTDTTTPINAHYLLSTFLIGLFTTGLHPKTSVLAIAMGHQIDRANGDLAKISGVILFSFLALLPGMFTLFLAVFHPTAGPAMKEKCTVLLEKHGRWLAALICFIFAAVLWNDALKVLPHSTP